MSDADNALVDVELGRFDGGVGLWGAVPALYDTTRLQMDRGIHVHARVVKGKEKAIDRTFRAVRILSDRLPGKGIIVSELEAIYYMVSTVLGVLPQNIVCPQCGFPHLDQDWFSVHPHREHVCDQCGVRFETAQEAVGNPIVTIRELCGVPEQVVATSEKTLDIRQSDFENGLLVWGSNPAFLWTGSHHEQEGMHIHVFGGSPAVPELDETYSTARIDGIDVNAKMVRLLMAQASLPILRGRIAAIDCPQCRAPQFDTGVAAFTPAADRVCSACGKTFSSPGGDATVSNPILTVFQRLSKFAVREPQRFTLDLPARRPAA